MKYSKEIVDKICGYIRAGAENKDAAFLVDVGESTFYDWQREKEADGTPNPNYHVEFVESLKKAEIERELRLVTIILKAAEKTWQAAAWYLERVFHDKYARKEFREHEIKEPVVLKLLKVIESEDKQNG